MALTHTSLTTTTVLEQWSLPLPASAAEVRRAIVKAEDHYRDNYTPHFVPEGLIQLRSVADEVLHIFYEVEQ